MSFIHLGYTVDTDAITIHQFITPLLSFTLTSIALIVLTFPGETLSCYTFCNVNHVNYKETTTSLPFCPFLILSLRYQSFPFIMSLVKFKQLHLVFYIIHIPFPIQYILKISISNSVLPLIIVAFTIF